MGMSRFTYATIPGALRRRSRHTAAAIVAALAALFALASAAAFVGVRAAAAAPDPPVPRVLLARIDDAIGPVTKDYVHRVLEVAAQENPECVVFTMDTPGGLDASMRSIVKDFLASRVPVVVFVHPSGARAASAGAIIGLSSHVLAMAPGTNIGAAHPVSLGQGNMDEETLAKVTNDAAAYARGIANQRGRDPEWAESIVRESVSSTAEEALGRGVADLVADDVDDLIAKLDGRVIETDAGADTLALENAIRAEVSPSLREKFLGRISDPNIAYLLLLLGIFGIFFELQNPGAIFPGVAGGIAILLAFFALQLLPVNLAGLALIVLAVVMFLLEIKVPSGGLLTVGGIASMLIGSVMLIDSPLPFMRVSLSVIVPAVIFTAAFFLFAVAMGMRAQKRKVTTGEAGIVGETGEARTDIGETGSVFVHGEHWNAVSDEPISAGSRIEVVGVKGMTLKVRRCTHKEVG